MISRKSPIVDIELTTFENLGLETSDSMAQENQNRPTPSRRSTDPSALPLSHLTPTLAPPRNRSPYSRSHLRSRSSASYLAPSMLRTHSMPSVDATGHLTTSRGRPSSPLGSPSRPVFRRGTDEDLKATKTFSSENASNLNGDSGLLQTPPGLYLNAGNAFPRRRRPSSPLQQVAQVAQVSASGAISSTSSSASSSPLMGPAKFINEPYPPNYPSSFSSSVSSTPTSPRSRSPSISSLETIPDSPDAEEAELEAERIAKLKAAADASDAGQTDAQKDNLDIPSGGRSGSGYGRERKRWSVCGAERRGDLDLETIWEV